MKIVLVSFFLATLLFQMVLAEEIQKPGASIGRTQVQFDSGQSTRAIPFEFVGNHIYLKARVNHSDPLWMLLDTGATSSYLDVQAAKPLSLGVEGESTTAVIQFHGARVPSQKFSIQPLRFGIYDGHAVDGLLGYDFISRFVLEINYENRTINLYDPETYQYSGKGETLPLVMLEDDSGGKVPLVRARILLPGHDPIDGKFIADTAVRGAITFNSPFVESSGVQKVPQKTIQAVLGGGAMVKESKQPLGRLPKVQLGRFEIKDTLAIFFKEKEGIVASPEFDGVIGGEVLRRFNVIFDYSRNQMIVEANRYFHDPFEYDKSGLLLIAEGPNFNIFTVKQLIENSPATEAGLHEGDVILAIGGKPASSLSLEQIRQMFTKENQRLSLTVKRGQEEIKTSIRLRTLI